MRIVKLYRYARNDGGINVSPIKPDFEYTEAYRLIADEGKALVKDNCEPVFCVDVESTDGWQEITATDLNKHGQSTQANRPHN